MNAFTITAKSLAAVLIAGATMATTPRAHAADSPCKPLTEQQCGTEVHCKWKPALRITYQVQGKDFTKETKSSCALAIKKGRAKAVAI